MKTNLDIKRDAVEKLKHCLENNVEPPVDLIKLGCVLCGDSFSEAYGEWNYRHIIKATGGVIPFQLVSFIEQLEAIA